MSKIKSGSFNLPIFLIFEDVYCKKTQRPITGKMQVARCSQCLNWLDLRSNEDLEVENQINSEIEWHLWVAESVMEVLASGDLTLETRARVAYVLFNSKESIETDLTSCSVKSIQWQLLKVFFH